MQIVDLAGIPADLRSQLPSLDLCDGDPPRDERYLRRLRQLGYPASDYWGVYGIDGDQLLARVEAMDLPFTGREGTQTVVGIAGVVTRPPSLGRGWARALLREVHRRAEAGGARWSFLWTHRSWAAHRLYESLGYQDACSLPYAYRRVPRAGPHRAAAGYRTSLAGPKDAALLERLFDGASRGRLGFVRRPPSHDRVRVRLGWRRWDRYRILRARSRPVGYAYISDDRPESLTVNEVAVVAPEHRSAMVAAISVLARGRWLALQSTSFVADVDPLLRSEGFFVARTSHTVLMARPLGPAARVGEDLREICADPGFSNHRGDMF